MSTAATCLRNSHESDERALSPLSLLAHIDRPPPLDDRRETLAYLLGVDFIPGDFRLALDYPCVHVFASCLSVLVHV